MFKQSEMSAKEIDKVLSINFGKGVDMALAHYPPRRLSLAKMENFSSTDCDTPEGQARHTMFKHALNAKPYGHNLIISYNELYDYYKSELGWIYEVLFTIDHTKFKTCVTPPTKQQLIWKINNFFRKYISHGISTYGIWETPTKSPLNLHCHTIVEFNTKTHKNTRKMYNKMINDYERQFGMCFSCRINTLDGDYQPTDKRGTRRNIGNFKKYYNYIHKTVLTDVNHSDSTFEGIVDTL